MNPTEIPYELVISFKDTSTKQKMVGVVNDFTEGACMYCILYEDGMIEKFPLLNIHRVQMQYRPKEDPSL